MGLLVRQTQPPHFAAIHSASEHTGTNLLLVLASVLAGASVLFSETGTAALGYPSWMDRVCARVPLLCNEPQQLAVAAAALGALWVLAKLLSSLHHKK
jgi:hypothetical protein